MWTGWPSAASSRTCAHTASTFRSCALANGFAGAVVVATGYVLRAGPLDLTTVRAKLIGMATRPERKRRSDGERSRGAILDEAGRLATVEGISGLSMSRLADAVGMSKSGLFAHFGSKEDLQ